ncbi:MAG TPA: type IV pili twitching motility protein PilT [Legionellales bacterium]|nr:type IV pili twitching motility protein PilT [Legionellales bacterium]|tara:strand:- start:1102 stop:2208 length:1107 start_codon:yes stop_codon:yes gene_type:complete
MDISPFFKLMVDKNASDLFFSAGARPTLKIEGQATPIGQVPLKPQQVAEIATSLMNDKQRKEFESELELNIAISLPEVGRFRVNVFRQRGEIAIVIRYIKGNIPTIESLNLPKVLKQVIMELRGLVLVVGATGSGKSTTLSSMIDYRNERHQGHILTIEDPIEYLYQHKKSIVDQREVGIDTWSFENALKNAMREAPDVILIGEIRDQNTMKHAITYAQTGHLCLSTLHANNANQTMERILSFFAAEAKPQVLQDLALNLRAIISLRLVPGIKNKRVPAVEVLLNSPYIADLIEKGKIDEIKDVMARSREYGMQTFDQALFDLYEAHEITQENAVLFADSKNNVALQIRLSNHQDLSENPDFTLNQDD